MAATDLEFVREVREGTAGFERLVDRYADDLFRLGCALTGNEADAYDLVQETFLAAMSRLAGFEGRSSIKTWLTRILFNLAGKVRRSRRVRRATSLDNPAGNSDGDAALQHRSPAAAVEARADVDAMLATLSDEHRQVLVLRELEGMSYQEIAEAVGVPVGTVESRLFRARRDLQRRFEGYFT